MTINRFVRPTGNDLLADGDDAITANAVATAALVDEARFTRGAHSAFNLDTAYRPGIYRLAGQAADFIGLPPLHPDGGTALTAQLQIIGGTPSDTWVMQDLTRYHNRHWERFFRVSSNTSGGWGTWQRISTSYPLIIDAGHSVDDYRTPGRYQVQSATHARTILGLPVEKGGMLDVLATSNDVPIAQIYYPIGEQPLYRSGYNATVGSPWGEWTTLGGASSTTTSGPDRNRLLIDDWTRRLGPVNIQAKAAVALRFDHGLNAFRDIVLPLLRERGFVSSQAMNSRTWDRSENNQVTPAEADTWDDVEFLNHGATHGDAATPEALHDEIVTGLTELRTQLPNHAIDGWAPPGVGGTKYMGYEGGRSAIAHAETEAGRLAIEHHAYATGYITDSRYRRLDGRIRQGLSHYTMDAARLDQVQRVVQPAIDAGQGFAIMLHPSLLNTDGYMDTATLTAVLDWLKERVTAGDIQIVTLGELTRAEKVSTGWDSGSLEAHSLLAHHTSETIGIRLHRAGHFVTMGCYVRRFDRLGASAGTVLFTLPEGFRPSAPYRIALSSDPSVTLDVLANGEVKVSSGEISLNRYVSFHLAHITSEPIPSTVPGPQ